MQPTWPSIRSSRHLIGSGPTSSRRGWSILAIEVIRVMRLDPSEITAITATAAQVFGPSATVRLFGSRVDDRRRGGDIDLYIEVDIGMSDLCRETDFRLQL